MTQTRSHRTRSSKQRTTSINKVTGSSGLGMLLIGIFIGAVLSALYFGFRENPDTELGGGLRHMMELSRSDAETSEAETTVAAAPTQEEKTTFDYYNVLPTIESIIPDDVQLDKLEEPKPVAKAEEKKQTDETKTKKTAAEKAPAVMVDTPEPGSFYVLQAGSFANFKDADSMKAQLALSGLQAHVQKVAIEGQGEYFRVRLGPFVNVKKLASTDQRLADQGIKAVRLKITKGG
ncbi:MAG: SPOR domain-containing protein [Gammaproteobacteria bacterium]|nr:SPOR domain-containing protein [Gammaproteobacteria bacterium]